MTYEDIDKEEIENYMHVYVVLRIYSDNYSILIAPRVSCFHLLSPYCSFTVFFKSALLFGKKIS